jgi:integrase
MFEDGWKLCRWFLTSLTTTRFIPSVTHMDKVTIPASEEEHPEIRLLSPDEVFSLIERLPNPINIAMLLVAATGVRISECLGLRWRHVLWDENSRTRLRASLGNSESWSAATGEATIVEA